MHHEEDDFQSFRVVLRIANYYIYMSSGANDNRKTCNQKPLCLLCQVYHYEVTSCTTT